MADTHQRKLDAVLVWKLDRFGRFAENLGIGVGTAHRIAQRRSKNICGNFGTGIEEVLHT